MLRRVARFLARLFGSETAAYTFFTRTSANGFTETTVNGRPATAKQAREIHRFFDEMHEWFDRFPRFPQL